jgi:hypothetical protein
MLTSGEKEQCRGMIQQAKEQVNLLDCGHMPSEHGAFTTGYATDNDGKKFCYACAAEQDKQWMREKGKITLYLVRNDSGKWEVINWPGSLRFSVSFFRLGSHNIAGTRQDVWFKFEGQQWHGIQYGENTQLCHCKRTRG